MTDRTEALDIEQVRGAIESATGRCLIHPTPDPTCQQREAEWMCDPCRAWVALEVLDRLITALGAAQGEADGWREAHAQMGVDRDRLGLENNEIREALKASNEEREKVREAAENFIAKRAEHARAMQFGIMDSAKLHKAALAYDAAEKELRAALSTPEQPVADPETCPTCGNLDRFNECGDLFHFPVADPEKVER